jgi:hypothetical protein
MCVCVCETWSLTLKEERKFRVFENMVLTTFIWEHLSKMGVGKTA